MKNRFPKVWCAQCGTMQFAGACGHRLVFRPHALQAQTAAAKEAKTIAAGKFMKPGTRWK